MQYIIKLDYEDLNRASRSQDEYNNLICRISKAIYEEMRKPYEHIHA